MKLIFKDSFGKDKPVDCKLIKETKQYITFRCNSNSMMYRYNKNTNEVQDGTYHNVIKCLKFEY